MFVGGCGSGTLFTVGGGSVRMVITLASFVLALLWGKEIGRRSRRPALSQRPLLLVHRHLHQTYASQHGSLHERLEWYLRSKGLLPLQT